MKPLTTQQQLLVERNHNLIYGFAHLYDLPIDDFYGILAISLCKAVQTYDDSKGKLSTYAYTIMYRDVCDEFKRINKENFFERNLKKYLTNDETYGIIFTHDLIRDIQQQLTDTQQMIITYLAKGYKQVEISRILNQSQSNIHQILKRCKNIIKEVLAQHGTGN